MADKYVNETGLIVIRDWINGKFALNSDLSTLSNRVDDIIAEGGEPNVIEIVKVNGTALTPDAQKAVNVIVPTKVSDLTNDGDGTQGSAFATEDYVDQNGGKIDVIKVNGTTQTITNKAVDITVPTKVSDITNDSGFQTASDVTSSINTALANGSNPYQTESDVNTAINSKISSVYKAKGTITFSQLPSLQASNEGFVYDISNSFVTTADFVEGAGKTYPAGTNVVIINTEGSTYKYDVLTGVTDLSDYWTSQSGQSNSLVAMTVAEINAILTPVTP